MSLTGRSNQYSWKDDLRPFAAIRYANWEDSTDEVDEYSACREMQILVEALRPEVVERLRKSVQRPTRTNCWFAMYNAALMLAEIIGADPQGSTDE